MSLVSSLQGWNDRLKAKSPPLTKNDKIFLGIACGFLVLDICARLALDGSITLNSFAMSAPNAITFVWGGGAVVRRGFWRRFGLLSGLLFMLAAFAAYITLHFLRTGQPPQTVLLLVIGQMALTVVCDFGAGACVRAALERKRWRAAYGAILAIALIATPTITGTSLVGAMVNHMSILKTEADKLQARLEEIARHQSADQTFDADGEQTRQAWLAFFAATNMPAPAEISDRARYTELRAANGTAETQTP